MPLALFPNPAIAQLLTTYQTIWGLSHLSALAQWDLETYMPQAGATGRGLALAKVQSLIQAQYLEPTFSKQIHQAAELANLTPAEQAVVRLLQKTLAEFEKLPPAFVESFEQTVSEAQVCWRQARERDDFVLFQPYLQKIVDLSIQRCDYLGYQDHPYNALLEQYEEGSTVAKLDPYFDRLNTFVKPLLSRIQKSAAYQSTHPLKTATYNRVELEQLNHAVLEWLRCDKDRLRIDLSTHPFTQSLSSADVRITTRYTSTDFAATLLSTVHEFGHALYELQIADALQYSPIGQGYSLGLHESQSRFWENSVGRSKAFIHHFWPQLKALHPSVESKDQVHRYLNTVAPGLIRVDADEVSYHLHIQIRYELEKALIDKRLSVKEVAHAWNEKYVEYLGVRPTSFREGVLQDIHWSMGGLGYFPTYSTGTVLSATWNQLMIEDLGALEPLLSNSEGIRKIQTWLGEHIHQYGATYTFDQLVQNATGKAFELEPWMHQLENKYAQLYP